MRQQAVIALMVSVAASVVVAADDGVVAVASGRTVTLFDPAGTLGTQAVETGPVPRLYPGPGGVVFAPDFDAARTSVIDLAGRRVGERLDGVTMPIFGSDPDRYVVVAGDVLVVSYPSLSVLAEVNAGIDRPWRTVIGPDGRYAMVLERGVEESAVTVVDVWQAMVQARHRVNGSVADMILLESSGVLALGDDDGGVRVIESASFAVLARWEAPSAVRAMVHTAAGLIVGCDDGTVLVVDVKLKRREIKVRERRRVQLQAGVQAVDRGLSGDRIVVLAEDGGVWLLDPGSGDLSRLGAVEGRPRDVVWVDDSRRGPLRPLWSDEARGGPESVGAP
jgi:hypothetical protein